MALGYDQPLYILPFDHRHSYGAEIFGFKEPLTTEQTAVVAHSKQVIYEGYLAAVASGVRTDHSGILVDEEFGTDILRDARRNGYQFALTTEKSGQNEFDFEYGDEFAKHIERFDPTFVKVLVRYNTAGDQVGNRRQAARLKRISEYLHTHRRLFMFELLVPAEPSQLSELGGSKQAYDEQMRPDLMVQAIKELQDYDVEPDIWKIEGLDRHPDCVAVVEAARRDGRDRVGCIVLGRGEDEKKVIQWLSTAATVPGFIGFAVGRSTFLDAIVDLQHKKITREQAVAQIAGRFEEWIKVFESARK
jgi:myo-inositol catabolism protein IolC